MKICVKSADVPIYPDDFYDFSTGVDISDKQINKWIEECITELEWEGNKEGFYTISSGNSYVSVHKNSEGYRIVVAKNHNEADIFTE